MTRAETYGGLVHPNETLDQAIRRLERHPNYGGLIASEAGQRLLEAAAVAARTARGTRGRLSEAELTAAYALGVREEGS